MTTKKPPTLPITNNKILKKAFTHRSYLNETEQRGLESNERLEFLGDAVLELAVSQFLFDKFPDKPEGELTALRAALVKTSTLADVANSLNFGDQLMMSRGETQTGGRENPSLLANTFEAVIGAIYLDSDFSHVTNFLKKHLFIKIDNILEKNLHRDFKSLFQELVQSKGHPTPSYKLIEESGPDHDKTFTMALMVGDTQIALGTGKSKQLSQQEAAKKGLAKLEEGFKL